MLLGKAVRFLDLDRRSHTLYQSCMFHLLAGEDLHPSQLPILWAIAQTGAISQGQVARVLGVSRAAVAVSAKRMERAGLVRREKGAGALELARRLEGFTQEEMVCLMNLYQRMNDNLERYRQELERKSCLTGEEVVC